MESNALDFDLASSVRKYLRLDKSRKKIIIEEVLSFVRQLKVISEKIGIPKSEKEIR